MERIRFVYKILTELRLTQQEVVALTDACEVHYDVDVQGLSKPGSGAILNGARNHFLVQHDAEWVAVQASSRQLDLLCKAMEMAGVLAEARAYSKQLLVDLYVKLRILQREASAEWENVNARGDVECDHG